MRKKLCNRCDEDYRPTVSGGGEMDLRHGQTEISANLCGSCYGDIVAAYKNEGEA